MAIFIQRGVGCLYGVAGGKVMYSVMYHANWHDLARLTVSRGQDRGAVVLHSLRFKMEEDENFDESTALSARNPSYLKFTIQCHIKIAT